MSTQTNLKHITYFLFILSPLSIKGTKTMFTGHGDTCNPAISDGTHRSKLKHGVVSQRTQRRLRRMPLPSCVHGLKQNISSVQSLIFYRLSRPNVSFCDHHQATLFGPSTAKPRKESTCFFSLNFFAWRGCTKHQRTLANFSPKKLLV